MIITVDTGELNPKDQVFVILPLTKNRGKCGMPQFEMLKGEIIEVNIIYITYYIEPIQVSYRLLFDQKDRIGRKDTFTEDKIFKNEEQCQAECNRLNNHYL